MRSLCVALLVFLASSAAAAQEIPKTNFLELYGQVPAPPADAKEAYARCEHASDLSSPVVDQKKYFQPMADKLAAISKKLEGTAEQLNKPLTDKMKSVDAEAIQKKMKSMSREEQIKYAMELNQQMGLGPKPMAAEGPKVTAALEEYQKITGSAGEDMQKAGEDVQKQMKVQEEREKKHKDVQAWYEAEYAKIPQLSSGEMSYAEPKALHALKMNTADKHLAVENDYLKGVRKAYQDELTKWKTRYSSLQQKLIAIRYGDDAQNVETKKVLVGAQGMMLNAAIALLKMSDEATKGPAQWYARKVQVQNEKVE